MKQKSLDFLEVFDDEQEILDRMDTDNADRILLFLKDFYQKRLLSTVNKTDRKSVV